MHKILLIASIQLLYLFCYLLLLIVKFSSTHHIVLWFTTSERSEFACNHTENKVITKSLASLIRHDII